MISSLLSCLEIDQVIFDTDHHPVMHGLQQHFPITQTVIKGIYNGQPFIIGDSHAS